MTVAVAQCVKCDTPKQITEFAVRRDRKAGVRAVCRECNNRAARQRNLERHVPDAEKLCPACSTTKPISEFHHRHGRALTPYGNGVVSQCKQCIKQRDADRQRKYNPLWRKAQVEKDKDFDRRNALKRYGITLEQFEQMLAAQSGVCKACKGPALGKGRYHVDHCHKTGRVRGLLCHKCNVALGMVGDSPELLNDLISYLRAELV